ncbi:transposase-like protein [Azospirillum lipoferum]|nr:MULTISPECIES: IS6 family transposase [Azospirillum]MCP1610829.1 transposase-like protein [Azospirillum lipoferum]MDW5534020.1 hypothetical protein [Azospirillum sp. NL1]
MIVQQAIGALSPVHAEIISEAVWLYPCFSLSLREVELILAARGIEVSYETIREWSLCFGREFATTLKRRRPKPGELNRSGFPGNCIQAASGGS